MAQESKEITSYTLSRMTNFTNIRAVINLYNTNAHFARLEFYPDAVPQKITVQDSGGVQIITAHYPIEAFPDIIDILRNEKPVKFVYEKIMGYARVETGKEPAGEGENAA